MENFFFYILKSSLILTLFYSVYNFFLKKDTFFTINRHFLLVGIGCSLTLPFIEFTTIEFVEQPVFNFLHDHTINPTTPTEQSTSIDWWLIIFTIYCIITMILLGRFIFQLRSLYKLYIKSNNTQQDGFNILHTPEDIAPFSFFSFIFFNPSNHTVKELEIILKHEKIHAKQYHTLDILLINLLIIFQWMNPFCWFYKKSIQQNLEFIADQEAILDLPSKKEYQLALLKVSSTNYYSITNNFYQSLIKKRIVMLNKKKSNHQNLWKLTIILPLLCLFLWGFNTRTEVQFIKHETIDESISFPSNSLEKIHPNKSKVPFKEQNDDNEHKEISNNHKKQYPILDKNPKTQASHHHQFPKNTKKSLNKKENNNKIEFIIDKKSTQEDLDKIKRIFENEYQVKSSFNNISRNDQDEIIGISLALSSKKNNASFSIKNNTPIKPILVSFDSNEEKISIGQVRNNNIWINENKHSKHSDIHAVEISSDDDKRSVFIVESDKNHKEKDRHNRLIIKSSHNDDNHIFINSNDHKTIFDFDGNSKKDHLFIIDGKKASKKEVKKLKPNDIQNVDISKGKASIKKYGKKAKNGVIEITTKKNAKKEVGFSFKTKNGNTINVDELYKGDSKLLIYLDEKNISYDKFKQIDPDDISVFFALKEGVTIKKYGDKAKNGTIYTTLKKK